MRKPRTPTEADIRRFWSKVDKTSSRSGCWLWTAGCFDNGYAAFSVGQNRPGHVIAYELTIGPVPDGLQLDHTCHDPTRCAPPCPHRRCVNPAHLEPVTPRENTLRSGALSALNAAKTQCPEGHPLSGVNLAVTGGRRTCKTCRRRDGAAYRARNPRTPKPPAYRGGESNGSHKLTWNVVDQIRAAKAGGETLVSLAERVAISKSQVKNIVYEKHWKTSDRPATSDADLDVIAAAVTK
jgi:hypothetical protein